MRFRAGRFVRSGDSRFLVAGFFGPGSSDLDSMVLGVDSNLPGELLRLKLLVLHAEEKVKMNMLDWETLDVWIIVSPGGSGRADSLEHAGVQIMHNVDYPVDLLNLIYEIGK